MKATPEQVFEALTKAELVAEWSGTEAVMNDKVGSKFSIWDGDMYGMNLEVVKNKKLVQEWCTKEWDEASRVTFTLVPQGKTTLVELLHENVPEKSVQSYADGWKQYYLGAIQEMFESQ